MSEPSTPRFSFLSTAYRTEDRVAGMIESVLAQTDPDWELVVVDNGLSDEMARIVGGYTHDPRIRLVRQPNRGAAGGINAASAAARGRYVSLLNSDDHVEPGFCARLGAVLDARPEVDAVCPDAWFFSATTGEQLPKSYLENWGAPRPDENHLLTLAELVEGLCPYYTGAVRREVWESHGELDADTVAVADLEIFLRIVGAGRGLVMVPDKLGRYCQAPESMSRGGRSVLALEAQREVVVTRHAQASGRPEDLAALERELRRSRHRRGVVGARVALFDGDVAGARRACDDALRERWDLRTAAIRAGLALAPGLVRRAYSATHVEPVALPPGSTAAGESAVRPAA
ncbi:glycosyltransferase family A protein [Pseudonocardia sp. KRD291]|uniref:glycosyltransferase family A protein n=1 Tax=Pseudonocardia sp. KRD291 TaxID=2792007 RepID=UPI001C4A4C2C|nr:glycosyltransferase family 2 protein [Pseudonocardia sp. KRD291]MBW0103471.1 glycosyltransferase family 2 protein [Pseudonocardia sp. KRD291]